MGRRLWIIFDTTGFFFLSFGVGWLVGRLVGWLVGEEMSQGTRRRVGMASWDMDLSSLYFGQNNTHVEKKTPCVWGWASCLCFQVLGLKKMPWRQVTGGIWGRCQKFYENLLLWTKPGHRTKPTKPRQCQDSHYHMVIQGSAL